VNAFNRVVMLIIALLLIAVPVLLLLIGFGVISAALVNTFTGYRAGLDALGAAVQNFNFGQGGRAAIAGIGLLLALVAGYLLLRELTFGRPLARRAVVERELGKETALTATAVKHLAEGAAREAGAASPTCYLASERGRYEVSCRIRVARPRNFTETATRARDNIRRVLEEQRVPVKDVEVTVQGTATES
jgi:hypothetical protein